MAPLWSVYSQWTLSDSVQILPHLVAVAIVLFVGALVGVGIVGLDRLPRRTPLDLRWLLGLLVVVPPVVAVLVMPFSAARHTSATLGMALLAATLGVVVLYRRRAGWA